MSHLISKAITDLRSEFEGGSALSLDWYTFFERGARNTLDNINPETLKRRVPIYGGIVNGLAMYYCPEDVRVPSAIYRQPNDRMPLATYTSPLNFYTSRNTDLFTIEYINGVRFMLVRQSVPYGSLTIDEMDEIGSKVSDVPLLVNDFDFVSGTAAIQRNFKPASATPGANEISDQFSGSISISDYLNGIITMPMVFENAKNISEVRFYLKTNAGNYYTFTSTQDSVGDNFIDGLNMVRFKISEKTATGTPTDTNIQYWALQIDTVAGTSETVIIDRITIQKSVHYYFEYYSNRMFIDGTTGAWIETPVANCRVNLSQEARDVLHYETTLLVAQSNTKIRESRSAFDNFAAQLSRKYNTYWSRYPSSEQPLSYNYLNEEQGMFLPEQLPSSIVAQTIGVENVNVDYNVMFVDNETPTGIFNGVNNAFFLSHSPNPVSSLMLWLNGTYLVQGSDYTLLNNQITFTSIPAALFAGLPFVAFYRYTV